MIIDGPPKTQTDHPTINHGWSVGRPRILLFPQHCHHGAEQDIRYWIMADLCSCFVIQCCVQSRAILDRVMCRQRTHGTMITSLLRQNDVATSFWRNNDVMIAPHAHWKGTSSWITSYWLRWPFGPSNGCQPACYPVIIEYDLPLCPRLRHRCLWCVRLHSATDADLALRK